MPEYEALHREFGDDMPEAIYRGRGCRNCKGTGYRGRQGVFELMPITDEIRSLVTERVASTEIRKMALRQGMATLRGDGLRLVREGRTTLEEVLRMTKDESMSASAAVLGVGTSADTMRE